MNPIDGLLLADLAAELPMAVRKQRLVETLAIVLLSLSAWFLAFRAVGPRWGLLG